MGDFSLASGKSSQRGTTAYRMIESVTTPVNHAGFIDKRKFIPASNEPSGHVLHVHLATAGSDVKGGGQ